MQFGTGAAAKSGREQTLESSRPIPKPCDPLRTACLRSAHTRLSVLHVTFATLWSDHFGGAVMPSPRKNADNKAGCQTRIHRTVRGEPVGLWRNGFGWNISSLCCIMGHDLSRFEGHPPPPFTQRKERQRLNACWWVAGEQLAVEQPTAGHSRPAKAGQPPISGHPPRLSATCHQVIASCVAHCARFSWAPGGHSSSVYQREGRARSVHAVRSFGCRQILKP